MTDQLSYAGRPAFIDEQLQGHDRPPTNLGTEGAVKTPAVSGDPSLNEHERHSGLSAPLSKRLRPPAPLKATIVTVVVRLLDFCRPAHVTRLVMAVNLDAVERVFRRWTFPDVCEERREVIHPLVTDTNTAAAIVGPAFIVRVAASLLGMTPRGIFSGAGASVRAFTVSGQLAIQASATSNEATPKVSTARQVFTAAVATADPFIALIRMAQRSQPPESLSGYIDQWSAHSLYCNS